MLSLVLRRSPVLSQGCLGNIMRAEPKKGAPVGKGAPVKKKAGGGKKKKNDRGPNPLDLAKVSPHLFNADLLPKTNADYPSWLFEIDEQLPRDKPVKILTPADGDRYYKQQNRKSIKLHNEIMLATKGKGL
ncbi:hypothetical protein SAMD00019534_050670 [Acytostelium subglobosum LB1]|uniref:hypothetical protein n=1 Tax=Acytostelium subglobosum LB1 TaxID=1410327 RepID=UPI000644A314|nr:hypothetical protein SAMD00019534_050670 [Acytostelium subglobosum LB1]GAM21892.1 hypothetical protein SAMD00019534_050670 [Acytostelium subglobosum LB1]|eukprot:XP_012754992.1 hypothetical protein SAMD00019534_050670 [Acytostelium subglobosum LB1]